MYKNRIFSRLEPLIIYFILYFPSLSTGSTSSDIYGDNSLIFTYASFSLIQIVFIYYFIQMKKTEKRLSGLKVISIRIFPAVFINLIPLLIIALSVNVILDFFLTGNPLNFNKSHYFIIKALAVSFLTGYREEIFFRSYLISSTEKSNSKTVIIALSSFLFAISHISGGIRAVITAFTCGIFLALIFIKHRNIHINALTHSLYNLIVLFL